MQDKQATEARHKSRTQKQETKAGHKSKTQKQENMRKNLFSTRRCREERGSFVVGLMLEG
jgi:hypothetical protein